MANEDDDKKSGVGEQPADMIDLPAAGSSENRRQAHLAYGRVYSQLQEQPEDELIVINFDVSAVVNSVLAVAPAVKRKRHLLEEVRPFDMRLADDLEDFALALAYTHSLVRIAEDTIETEDIPYLMAKRTQLLNDGKSLAGRGLLDAAKLAKLSHTNNHSELAYDALGLAELFLQAEDRLRGKSPVPREELEEVRDRANRVILALSIKGEKQTSLADALLERRRAATKLVKAHRKVRVALQLVLGKIELVNEIIPELQVRKRTKKRKGESAEVEASEQDPLDDGFDDDTDVDVDEAEAADADTEVVKAPAAPPRNSVVTTKATATSKSLKTAVGDGLPGASPVEDEE